MTPLRVLVVVFGLLSCKVDKMCGYRGWGSFHGVQASPWYVCTCGGPEPKGVRRDCTDHGRARKAL